MAFDPALATREYIDALGAPALEKAAAYTAGGHWLLLWNLLIPTAIAWIVVRSRVLDRLDARLATRGRTLRSLAISAAYLVLSSLLALPWAVYADWWRETSYGRTSQPLGDFLGQGALSLVLSAVLGGLFFTGIYALLRRAGRRWWLWSGAFSAAAISLLLLLGPVAIEPLFNEFRPVPPGAVRDAVVVLAKDAGIAPEKIYVFDGSRQSNNFTANVAGLGGAARIAISDVALKGASLDEVKAVTGHEIGHYVLGHVWRTVGVFAVLAMLFFYLADRAFPWFARIFGARGGVADPVTLPVLLVIVSVLGLLAQPLTLGLTRLGEMEADDYSLRHVNLPDALASALVKTAEYRDPRPGALQELLFYSHPSVERRVRRAMDWKASHAASP